MADKYPFLYAVPDKWDSVDIGAPASDANWKYVVMLAESFDYKHYWSNWMHDSAVGDHCMVPDIDIRADGDVHTFATEQEALDFIKAYWKSV